jgi:hypothetical protein
MRLHRLTGGVLAGLFFSVGVSGLGSTTGCSSTNNTVVVQKDSGVPPQKDSGIPTNTCNPPLADDDYAGCSPSCKFATGTDPATQASACAQGRNVNACCAWVTAPVATLTRAEGLHDYSSNTPTPDFSCLGTPPVAGASHTSTLSGFVKIFSSYPAGGTVAVKVEVFKVNTATGALGAQLGTYTTQASDKTETNSWLNACTSDPCTFYQYKIAGIPTETPLVIKTSDGGGTGLWTALYDYNIYFADDSKCVTGGGPCVQSQSSSGWTTNYDVTAATPDDISTAALTVGLTASASQGVLAGEVHDCGDIRIAGANVDTDQEHDGSLFYFGPNEAMPLPDETRGSNNEGTSALGLFGALNMAPGVPIRVSAIGIVDGKDTLLGTAVVQVYGGPSVTAVSLRGRRPYQ